jgi:hypothetical protein
VGQADQERQHYGAVGLLYRVIAGLAVGGAIAAALFVIVDRIDVSGSAQERRALIARNADLTREAMTPGSALSCLESDAGQSVEKACELSVFAAAHSLTAALSFVGERIKLLELAQSLVKSGDAQVLADLAHERQALERDRFGIAAHVLAQRYGCNAETCDALALFKHTATLKRDLKAQPFEALIAKYEGVWDKPGEPRVPVAELPRDGATAASTMMSTPATDALAKADPPFAPHPLDKKWKLPSADSIPAISIMAPEPKLPKAEAQPDPKAAEQKQAEQKPAAPLPPKRPQAQAVPAEQR